MIHAPPPEIQRPACPAFYTAAQDPLIWQCPAPSAKQASSAGPTPDSYRSPLFHDHSDFDIPASDPATPGTRQTKPADCPAQPRPHQEPTTPPSNGFPHLPAPISP